MRWGKVLAVAALLGLVALLILITTPAQLSGEANVVRTIRLVLSKILNSGTVWGGLLFLAGWLVRSLKHAWLAGPVAGLSALAVHYGLGQLLGMTALFGASGWDLWVSNQYWFCAALLFGPPLGLLGALACHQSRWGLVARLSVPVAAVAEPIWAGMFTPLTVLPVAERFSDVISGSIMLSAGGISAALLVKFALAARQPEQPSQADP